MRRPAPATVVIDPATIMIRSPTPGLVADPRPPVRRAPCPATVTVRSPLVIIIDDGHVRSPYPAVVVHINPVTVGVQIFRAPDVIVVVAIVVMKPLRKVMIALRDPLVPEIRGGRVRDIPVAVIALLARRHERRAVTIAQCEA